jgi:hypothetical protein
MRDANGYGNWKGTLDIRVSQFWEVLYFILNELLFIASPDRVRDPRVERPGVGVACNETLKVKCN